MVLEETLNSTGRVNRIKAAMRAEKDSPMSKKKNIYDGSEFDVEKDKN